MKIKKLFDKVENANLYNEIADKQMNKVFGLEYKTRIYVYFIDLEGDYMNKNFYTYNEFVDYVKEEYIDEVSDKLLNANVELDKETTIKYPNWRGGETSFSFKIQLRVF